MGNASIDREFMKSHIDDNEIYGWIALADKIDFTEFDYCWAGQRRKDILVSLMRKAQNLSWLQRLSIRILISIKS